MLGREWTGVTVIEAKLKKVLLKAEAAGTRYIYIYTFINTCYCILTQDRNCSEYDRSLSQCDRY
jgi:hypothetical protein